MHAYNALMHIFECAWTKYLSLFPEIFSQLLIFVFCMANTCLCKVRKQNQIYQKL